MVHKTPKIQSLARLLIVACLFGYGTTSVFAQSGTSSIAKVGVSYVPLVGITLVPKPFSLPKGPGEVVYQYAVKNFLREAPLTDIYVVDDTCDEVKFVEGDDNKDLKLDFSETWRYTCTTKISSTTQSTATVVAASEGKVATHDAYATVVVGTDLTAPLISVINITKIAYPLSLPATGGVVTFTYKVNNPGTVPLGNVVVSDKKCQALSNKLGDRNNNNLLDVNEVWIYTCKAVLTKTTINTVSVSAVANGMKATSQATIEVKVLIPGEEVGESDTPPLLEETTKSPDDKMLIWAVFGSILVIISVCYVIIRNAQKKKSNQQHE